MESILKDIEQIILEVERLQYRARHVSVRQRLIRTLTELYNARDAQRDVEAAEDVESE